MNRLNEEQLSHLARRGIETREECGPVIECLTSQGVRYYTVDDLRQIAKPGFLESMRHWLSEVAA